jgi:hypothetical protein
MTRAPTSRSAAYPASQIKRARSTKQDVQRRRDALCAIAERSAPATVRQIYYLATVAGLVPKTEGGYDMVQTDLTLLRRAGTLPYGWLADSTRWQRKPKTFGSIQEALEDTARLYRKALWTDADAYVEVWLEKDALAGVVSPITSQFDVPLMVARGYASLSFLHGAAEYIAGLDVPTYIYHCGDYDPSGQDAARAIEETLRKMAPQAEIHFERLAVTPSQIRDWRLPSRPTKKSDSRARGFSAVSVELDAIPPGQLRTLIQHAIERHLPPEQYRVLQIAEESERQLLDGIVGMAKSKLPPPESRSTRMPMQTDASLGRYFSADWLTKEDNAAWTLYAESLRAKGHDVDKVVEWCGYLIESRGYEHPADYMGPEQWGALTGAAS